MKTNLQNSFFVLSAPANPDTDFIYQWNTDLCIKVRKTKLAVLSSNTPLFIYRMLNHCLYVFETIGNALYSRKEIRSAINWYASYYSLSLTVVQDPDFDVIHNT